MPPDQRFPGGERRGFTQDAQQVGHDLAGADSMGPPALKACLNGSGTLSMAPDDLVYFESNLLALRSFTTILNLIGAALIYPPKTPLRCWRNSSPLGSDNYYYHMEAL